MARLRSFSSELKRQIAKEFLDGRAGLHELARRHSLLRNLGWWVGGDRRAGRGGAHRRVRAQDRRARAQGRPADDGSRSAQKRGAVGTPAQRRELLHRERAEAVSVARGCRIMKLARSTYYYRGRRRAAEKMALRDRIEALCAECPRDGYRRITHQLRAEGTVVNHKAVARLMRRGRHSNPRYRLPSTPD